MARVVLLQIKLTRAMQNFVYVTVPYNVIFLPSKPKMHEITAADSGMYIVGHYTGHRGHYTDHYYI